MPHMKAWKAIKSLHFRSCVHQHKRAVESDLGAITCKDATNTFAISSQQHFSNAASTIHSGADADARISRFAEVRDIFYLPQLDPQPTKHAKIQLVRDASDVDALMETFSYRAPSNSTVASCLPHQDMWLPCELAEQVEIPEKTFLDWNEYLFHNPHDMLASVFNTRHAAKSLEDFSWVEERDKDVLREYFQDLSNIVLHSDCPHIAPHIVITPAQETSEDFYIPWNNRTLPQWWGFLMVPPCDLTTGRLYPPDLPLVPQEPNISCLDGSAGVGGGSGSHDPTCLPDAPKRVFNYSQFNSFAERTANERLILYHVVKALQKHQCKAAAYAASTRATEFCRRYKIPEFLASIEKPFVWTDPAEPLLLSSRHAPGAMILESSCPFFAPHIVITTPPTQNPWIPWHNAVNDPQDGHYLIVPSPRVNYINMDEEEDVDLLRITSSAASSKFFFASDEEEEDDDFADSEEEEDSTADHSDSPPSSRPGSPGPETPTDDSASLRGFFQSRRPSFVIDEDDEDERALALAIAKNAVEEYYQSTPLLRVSLPMIEEEGPVDGAGFSSVSSSPVHVVETDEGEGLPPLDNWYLNIASRTMRPAVSVA